MGNAPGTAASAALAVARAAAVASKSAAVFFWTRSRIFLRMKWYSCSTARSCASYTPLGTFAAAAVGGAPAPCTPSY